jgi:niacin transporter
MVITMFRAKNRTFSAQKLILTGLFIAIGVILPRFFPYPTGMAFLPMHIPILLCGIVCGLPYGIISGLAIPLISHFTTGFPPSAVLPAMLCELAAYGLFTSLLMKIPVKSFYARVCVALYGAMLLGRVVFGAVNMYIFNVGEYSVQIWMTAAFVTALPGIVIQVIIIPPIVMAAKKTSRGLC